MAEFLNGAWYRLKANPGGSFDQFSGGKQTVYFNLSARVVGGAMADTNIPCPIMLINDEEGRARFRRNCLVLGFDSQSDLNEMGEKIAGKEFWGRCDISPKERGGGFWPAKITEIADLKSRIPGGPAHKAAEILGNTATPAPDPNAFAENF